MTDFLKSVDELGDRIADGARLAVPPDYSGCAMAAVRSLMRRSTRDLDLLGVPQVGFQGDMLIGAGCVASLETAALTLGETSPDSEGLPDADGMLGAGVLYRTDSADCLGLHLPPFPLFFPFEGRWWKEQICMVPTAQRLHLPVVQVRQSDSSRF